MKNFHLDFLSCFTVTTLAAALSFLCIRAVIMLADKLGPISVPMIVIPVGSLVYAVVAAHIRNITNKDIL